MTGAAGFVGWNLARRMVERKLSPVLTQNNTPVEIKNLAIVPCNLSDQNLVERLIDEEQPDAIIHCAALAQTNQCEHDPHAASQGNVIATANLLSAMDADTRFIFLSTDLVFDGLQGDYRETDPAHPMHQYGKTKYEAERLTLDLAENTAVVRTALVYGPDAPRKSCFLGWMHEGCRKGELTLFEDEFRTPIFVDDLSDLLIDLIESKYCGLLHAAGPERLSRYDFGLKFCKVYGYDPKVIAKRKLSDLTLDVYRSPDVSMDISLAKKILKFNPVGVEDGLQKIETYNHTSTN